MYKRRSPSKASTRARSVATTSAFTPAATFDPVGTHALVDAKIAGVQQRASAFLSNPAFARYNEGEQRRFAFGAANALGRARERLIRGVDDSDCVPAQRAQPHGAGEGSVARRLGGRAHVDFDQMVADGVLPTPHALRQG